MRRPINVRGRGRGGVKRVGSARDLYEGQWRLWALWRIVMCPCTLWLCSACCSVRFITLLRLVLLTYPSIPSIPLQEPPLRISRAAGYGERYGRAAGTQHTRKELSSYAFCPMSNLFRRIFPWLPSSMSVEIFNENHPVSAEYICYLI